MRQIADAPLPHITQPRYPEIKTYKLLALTQSTDAPSLQSVRFVQASGSAPWLPIVCHLALCLPAHADVAEGPIADLSHVPDRADEFMRRVSAQPEFVDRRPSILHVLPNACMVQQRWAVTDERLHIERPINPSDGEYLPPGGSDEDGEWDDGTSQIADDGSVVSSCVDSEAEDPEERGNYDRETVLRMFRAGLEDDFVLDDLVGTP